jgi:hypothetical protein
MRPVDLDGREKEMHSSCPYPEGLRAAGRGTVARLFKKSGATMMNKCQLLGWALLPALVACGCATHTETGALTGGAIGTAVGAVAGAAAHAPLAGAAIGALAGTAIGATAGHAEDRAERRAANEAIYAQRMALPIDQVVSMAHNHVSDTIIINQIRSRGAVYSLTGDDITYLKSQGVSDAVVSEMQATAVRYPQPVYGAPRYYVADPPPVSVGVGVRF